MSAVVRVKRRIDEDPLSALVLNCKRRRVGEGAEVRENLFESRDEVSTILKFAGTVESQDESISSQITRLSKDDAKELVQKTRKPNIPERSRQEMRHSIQENRFKVVNCYRAVKDDEETPQEITVVDIEKQTNDTANSNSSGGGDAATAAAPQTAESQPPEGGGQYVYDLYLPESGQQPSELNYVDTYLSVRPFDDLVYEDNFNNELDDDDSEDSNQENYWRNDYPDTEEESSIDESHMRRAVARTGIDDEAELSSDYDYEYGDSYVHTVEHGDSSVTDLLSPLRNKYHKKKNADYDEHDSELDESD